MLAHDPGLLTTCKRALQQLMALLLVFSMAACAAQNEPAPIASDREASIKPFWWRRLDYSRCYTVLQELGTRPEFEAEVAALQADVGDDGLSTAQVICTHVGETTHGLSGSLATTMGSPGVGTARAFALVLGAVASIAIVATAIDAELVRHLVAGMLFDESVQTPAELAKVDIDANYDAAWAALPFESQQSLAAHKDWLKDMIVAWVATYSNSIDAKRAKPGTKYCYAVVFGDNEFARDTWDYAVSDCAVDDGRCGRAQNAAVYNMRLKQSATPSIGIYYNACTGSTGFFTPQP